MTPSFTKRRALEVSGSTALVIAAAFVPWGEVDFTKTRSPFEGELGEGLNQMMMSFGTVPVTVGNGHADIGLMKLPNALVVLAAIAALVLSWFKATCVWNVPTATVISLAMYGLAHSAYVLINLVIAPEGSPGFGVFLSAIGFAWMLVAALRRDRSSEPARLPNVAEQCGEPEPPGTQNP